MSRFDELKKKHEKCPQCGGKARIRLKRNKYGNQIIVIDCQCGYRKEI